MIHASTSVATAVRRRPRSTDARASWLMLAPTLLVLSAFVIGPLILGVGLSFTHYDLMTGQGRFNGVTNYRDLFAAGSTFWIALLNTVLFTLGTVVPTITLAVFFGILLNQHLMGRTFYRTVLFAPYVTPLVGASIAWIWLFRRQGFVDWIMQLFGVQGPGWLSSPHTALIAIIIATLWQYTGYFTMLVLSGLQAIPPDVTEAARIDGAHGVSLLRQVVLPLLSPTILFCLILSVIQSFQVFDQIYVMTDGGPGTSTLTLVYYLYQEGFEFFRIGHGAAVGVVLLAVLLTFTALQLKLSSRWVHYDL